MRWGSERGNGRLSVDARSRCNVGTEVVASTEAGRHTGRGRRTGRTGTGKWKDGRNNWETTATGASFLWR